MDWFVVATFLGVIALEVLIPLLLGYFFTRKLKVPWKVFLFGALFFILIQVIHIPFVLFTQGPLYSYLTTAFAAPIPLAILALYLGLLAGLFEEIGRFLIFKYFFPNQKIGLSRETALQFGAGWGGVESALVGILVLFSLLSYTTLVPFTADTIADLNVQSGGTLTDEQASQIETQAQALAALTPLDILPGLFERLMTILLHMSLTLLVFYAVVEHKKSFLVLAIALHAGVDAAVVFLHQQFGLFAAYGALVVFVTVTAYLAYGIWTHAPRRTPLSA